MTKIALKKLIAFAKLAGKLKDLERFRGQFFWRDYPQLSRYESVADHTWRVALLLILLRDHLSQKINLEKALKIIVVHDLPEVITGDESPLGKDGTGKKTYAFNQKRAKARHLKEVKAAKSLFNTLPKNQSRELYKLWLEYEEQKTFESRVIKSLDKLEAVLQVQQYRRGNFFKKHLDFNITYGLRGSDVDPLLTELGKQITGEMLKSFKEFRK